MRELIALKCDSCENRNYTGDKNKKTMPNKITLKKYCKFCRKHTVHSETKVK